jgi:hypothetical protein
VLLDHGTADLRLAAGRVAAEAHDPRVRQRSRTQDPDRQLPDLAELGVVEVEEKQKIGNWRLVEKYHAMN